MGSRYALAACLQYRRCHDTAFFHVRAEYSMLDLHSVAAMPVFRVIRVGSESCVYREQLCRPLRRSCVDI